MSISNQSETKLVKAIESYIMSFGLDEGLSIFNQDFITSPDRRKKEIQAAVRKIKKRL